MRRAVARLQRSFRCSRDLGGPTGAQLSALGTLIREGPMATGELAQRERLKPQSVTRLVAGLLEQKLAERLVDASDRRRLVVAITPEGRRRLEIEMARRDERLAARIAQLPADDRAVLRAAAPLLDRLSADENEA